MKKHRVHYIGQYNIPQFEHQGRMFSPAASKALYIIRALNEIGYRVNFISFANSRLNRYCRAAKAKLNSMTKFYLAPYLPNKKYTERFMYLWLIFYAILNIKRGDILLVWHTNSMRNDLLLKIVKWKKMQFVYEVEEVFTLANPELNHELIQAEIMSLQCPDKYIFNNITLGETVNLKDLPQIICHGEYIPAIRIDKAKFKLDGKIHCVYAGIIDEVKCGAFRAVEAARYLPDNYVVNILGFGYGEHIDKLKKRIEEVNSESEARVIFHGRMSGMNYYEFLNNCDIALALQDMRGSFNDTSFPSKLLVYLCASLPVVAPYIKCIYNTKVNDLINYYYEDNAESIANAIKNVKLTDGYDPSKKMKQLHEDFKKELANLLEQ